MSYCRFSSDDYRCEIYAYESADGIQVHVGMQRIYYRAPLPEPFVWPKVVTEADVQRWLMRDDAVRRMRQMAHREPLNLPYAGESFVCDEYGDAANFLAELKRLGYRFPDYAIESLREDQAERDAGGNYAP